MKANKKTYRSYFLDEGAIIGYLVLAKLLLHLLLPEYGFHRDELYYIAVGDGFNFSNLDMPPLAPLSLRLFTLVFGHSIKVVHFVSALFGTLSILVACLITKELGGKKYAMFLSGIILMFSAHVAFGSLYTYDSPSFLIWLIVLWLLVKIFKGQKSELWIVVGFVLGVGFLTKLTILFLGLAIFVSLWLVPQRTFFKDKWIWIAGIIAVSFSIPYLIWQSQHGWYFLKFADEYVNGMSYDASFKQFFSGQIFTVGLSALPFWLGGLGLLLFSPRWKTFRFFGFCYLFLYCIFYFIHTPFYFLLPLYPVLVSAGTVTIEEYLLKERDRKVIWRLAMPAIPVACIVLSLPLLPMSVPILPIEQFIKYAAVLGVNAGVKTNSVIENQLPQHVADRFGWQEMTATIAKVYHNVSRAENGGVGIITANYGEASAIHFYRSEYDLPEPISTHGWFYFETLRSQKFVNTYVAIGMSLKELNKIFMSVERKGVFLNAFCIPYENNQAIYICRQPKVDLKSFWSAERQH